MQSPPKKVGSTEASKQRVLEYKKGLFEQNKSFHNIKFYPSAISNRDFARYVQGNSIRKSIILKIEEIFWYFPWKEFVRLLNYRNEKIFISLFVTIDQEWVSRNIDS